MTQTTGIAYKLPVQQCGEALMTRIKALEKLLG
jgi:hypothetical protein